MKRCTCQKLSLPKHTHTLAYGAALMKRCKNRMCLCVVEKRQQLLREVSERAKNEIWRMLGACNIEMYRVDKKMLELSIVEWFNRRFRSLSSFIIIFIHWVYPTLQIVESVCKERVFCYQQRIRWQGIPTKDSKTCEKKLSVKREKCVKRRNMFFNCYVCR